MTEYQEIFRGKGIREWCGIPNCAKHWNVHHYYPRPENLDEAA